MRGQERSMGKITKPVAIAAGILIGIYIFYSSLSPRKPSGSYLARLSTQHDETGTKVKAGKTATSSNELAIGNTDSSGNWDSDDYSADADYDDVYWNEGSPYAVKQGIDTGTDHFGNAIKHKNQERQRKKRPPNFIIIGARKCGTRALLAMLALHPGVTTAGPEVHYFDRDENYQNGLDWYIDQMKPSTEGQLSGEKSPSYFIVPQVPERVKDYFLRVQKEPKLLLVLREPVSRVVSDFTQGLYNKGANTLDSAAIQAKFIAQAIDPITKKVNQNWSTIKVSEYSDHLQRWWRWFPREQLLIVNGDNLQTNPIQEMTKVSKFLKLDRSFDWKSHLYYNETRGFYCFKDDGSPVCLGSSKGRKHPDINATILNKLYDYYKPFNEKLKSMTGLDFQRAKP